MGWKFSSHIGPGDETLKSSTQVDWITVCQKQIRLLEIEISSEMFLGNYELNFAWSLQAC